MRIGVTVWIMVVVLSGAAVGTFALEHAGASPTATSKRWGISADVQGTGKGPSLTGCRIRLYREDLMRAPFQLIIEGPIPSSGSERPLTPSEAKCVENLRKAGKKAVVGGKINEAILHYLSAVDTAAAQAGETYLELASVLDQAAYPQPAVIAYRKAWMAFEAGYNLRGVKAEGTGLLTLANIRDSIVRLGGQVPSATSLPGKIVESNSTRRIQEEYFEKALPRETR